MKIGIFASGKGTLVNYIAKATNEKTSFRIYYMNTSLDLLPIQSAIQHVIYTDNEIDLSLLNELRIPSTNISYSKKRELAEEEIKKAFDNELPDFIVLSGFTKILSQNIISFFSNRILNLHLTYSENLKGNNLWNTIYKTYKSTLFQYKLEKMICGPSMFWISEKVDDGVPVSYGLVPFTNTTSYDDFYKSMWLEEIKLTNLTLSSLCDLYFEDWITSEEVCNYKDAINSIIEDSSIESIDMLINLKNIVLNTGRKILELGFKSNLFLLYRQLLVTHFLTSAFNSKSNKKIHINGYELVRHSLEKEV